MLLQAVAICCGFFVLLYRTERTQSEFESPEFITFFEAVRIMIGIEYPGGCIMMERIVRVQSDYVPVPYVCDVSRQALMNTDFRTTLWTGCHAQMTLMCIPVCSDIGLEIHEDTDQMIRIEQGTALVKMGECERNLDFQVTVCEGDTVFVPAGIWHNIINIGRRALKLSSVYAPPHHPVGTVHHTKEDAERASYG